MLRISLMALLMAAADGGSDGAPPRLTAPDGSNAAGRSALLLRGKSLMVTADKTAVWSAEPAGFVEIRDGGNGKMSITALRDAFDEPDGREPQATIRACDGEACTAFTVTCLIDTSGNWKLSLVGKWLGIFDHAEERAPVFVQSGRDVSFEDKPKDAQPPYKIIRLRLHGTGFQLKDGGGALKMFSGRLKDRRSGDGRFDSVPGFAGTWKAMRSP